MHRRLRWRAILAAVLPLIFGSALLTAPPASAAYPGGNGKLLFVRANQIYTIASSGGAVTKLTSSGKNYWAKWSPDGKRIAYVNEPSAGKRDVWVMQANGTSKQRVTSLSNVNSAPAWEPNGRRLAFAAGAVAYGADSWLYLVRSTSPFGAPTVAQGRYWETWEPAQPVSAESWVAWDPDGQHIRVYNEIAYDCDSTYICLHEFNVADGKMTHQGGSKSHSASDLFYGPGGAFGYTINTWETPDWSVERPRQIVYPGFVSRDYDEDGAPSPNGRYMAFTNAASGKAQVYTSTITGSSRRVLTQGYSPDWQPLP